MGRLSHEKNLAALLTAFRAIEAAEPEAHLVLVGDGPARHDLEQSLAGHRARFTGYLRGEALAQAYASADLFAFPSITETFGQAVLEALASGLPVVAYDAEGVRDLVQHEATGLLASPGDAAAFIQHLKTLLAAPEHRLLMSVRARRAAEGRTWEKVMNDLLQTYEHIISQHQRRHAA